MALLLFFVGFQRQQEGRDADVKARDQRDLGRPQRIGDRQQDREQRRQQGEDVFIEEKRGGAGDVVDIAPPLGDDLPHVRKVRIQKDHLRGLPGRVAPAAHGHGAVRLFHGQDIVHAVAGHGDFQALFLHGEDQAFFLFRAHAPENGVFQRRFLQFFFRIQRRGVHVAVRVRDIRLRRHARDRHGIVAGDDLHGDTLRGKAREGLLRVLADPVLQHHEEQRPGIRLPSAGKGQHPLSRRRPALDILPVLLQLLRGQQIFRRAQAVGGLLQIDLRILFAGVKGLDSRIFKGFPRRKIRAQRLHGDVAVRHAADIGRKQRFDLLLRGQVRHRFHRCRLRRERFALLRRQEGLAHVHLRARDGPGLVQAEHVHPRQSLDAAHIVQQDFLPREPHGA